MAVIIVLRVGDTSALDISLTSDGVTVLDYPMGVPEIDQATIQSLGDGNGLSIPSWSNVTESLELHISGATAALAADKVRTIERVLDLARQGTLGHLHDRVYIRVHFDQDAIPWRSQILAARLELPEGSKQIWKKYVRATLIITRRYYWETEAMQAVEATSGVTTTPTTGYAVVYNADDTSIPNRNYLWIDAAQVQGSIPAPAKIYIKNTSGASRALGSVYLGNYVFNEPATNDPIFRTEDAAFADTTAGTVEQEIYNWDLSSTTLVDSFRGQFGRFVVVWSDRAAATTLLRAALQYRFPAPVFDLALGEQFLPTDLDFVTDLGALPIPPSGYIAGLDTNLYLALKAKAASGTDTLGVDWLQIFPSGAGRYRVIKGIVSYTIGSNEEVIDDGPNGVVYGLSGGAPAPLFRPLFTPIYLWPGRINLLRMVISGGSSIEPGVAWSMKTEYRPRRLSF